MHTEEVRALFEKSTLRVKFDDSSRVRLRKGRLVDLDGRAFTSKRSRALFERLKGARWEPMHSVDEKTLARFRRVAMKQPGPRPSDLSNYYFVVLPPDLDILEVGPDLDSLREVEFALPALRPIAPPVPPDLSSDTNPTGSYQGYLYPGGSPRNGVDAQYAWTIDGGNGQGVSICDIEYAWNRDHNDLQGNGGVNLLGPAPLDPITYRRHGTSVLGIYGSTRSASGTTEQGTVGIAHGARKHVATVFAGRYNIPGAITSAMDGMQPGDVILIEQHIPGPASRDVNPYHLLTGKKQEGLVAVEWCKDVYDTVVQAVGNGFIVVEAAGNGRQDLDDDMYSPSDEPVPWPPFVLRHHRPFQRRNDSGAIFVGAGTSGGRERMDYSNHGARLDLQGWGENVVTTAGRDGDEDNADLWGGEGSDWFYTRSFAGTSSASAMIAGVCASLQGIFKKMFGRPATCRELRRILVETGRSQEVNFRERIGPLPDLRRAVAWITRDAREPLLSPIPAAYPAQDSEPFHVYVLIRSELHLYGRSWEVWTSVDGSEPGRDLPGSRLLFRSPAREGTIRLEPGSTTVKAVMYVDSQEFGGLVRSIVASGTYEVYSAAEGPRNLTATQGTSTSETALTWDPIPGAVRYEVFTGNERPSLRVSSSRRKAAVGGGTCAYSDTTAPTDGTPIHYYVRALVGADERRTRFSGPAEGFRGITPLEVTMSTGPNGGVLLEWSDLPWAHFFFHAHYRVYRGTLAAPLLSRLIFESVPGVEEVPIGNTGVTRRLPTEPPMSYEDTNHPMASACYYWVRGLDILQNIETPFGEPVIWRPPAANAHPEQPRPSAP